MRHKLREYSEPRNFILQSHSCHAHVLSRASRRNTNPHIASWTKLRFVKGSLNFMIGKPLYVPKRVAKYKYEVGKNKGSPIIKFGARDSVSSPLRFNKFV